MMEEDITGRGREGQDRDGQDRDGHVRDGHVRDGQELAGQLEKLARALEELEQVSKKALGFVHTIEYEGIPFNISRRFVIADLSPLSFFHLLEHIEDGDPAAAIARLYERLNPLLTCRHEWTVLRREEDERMRTIVGSSANGNAAPYICKACTAYALGPPLPVVGRGMVERKAGPISSSPKR